MSDCLQSCRRSPVVWLAIVVLGVAGISGCGESESGKSASKTSKQVRVGVESKTANAPPTTKRSPATKSPSTAASAPATGVSQDTASASVARWPKLKPAKFSNVAKRVGVNFQYYNDQVRNRFLLVESMGGAVAWFDMDRDGHQDLYLANGNVLANPSDRHTNRLLKNVGGKFGDVTPESIAGDIGYAFGLAVGDFDADGFDDVFVTNFGPNTLLRNNGDGTFTKTRFGPNENKWSTGCVWFDANADGLLDVFVANYLSVSVDSKKVCEYDGKPGYCGPQQYSAEADQVWINRGDGTFANATSDLGFDTTPAYSLGVMAVDLDHDTQPEIIVATDMTPNSLFARGSGGTWSDRASAAGVDAAGTGELEAGMGIACADYDADGKPDFLLTHYFEKKNTLYRNLGDMVFPDDSARSRIQAHSLSFLGFGANVVDVNRDGSPDLFIANGHVLGPNHDPSEMTAQVLLNNGQGRFEDVSARSGSYFFKPVLGRGSATADFDNDGDADIAVVHLDKPVAMLEDRGKNPSWIGLRIRPDQLASTSGGRVEIHCGDWSRTMPLVAGGSYLSVNDTRLLSAVPEDGKVTAKCFWPDGRTAEIELPRNRYSRLTSSGVVSIVD